MTVAGTTHRIEASHTGLTLTKRTILSNLSDFRKFNDHAGKFDREINSDGSWNVFDRSDGGNIFTVEPPSGQEPTFIKDEFASNGYRETKVNEIGNRVDVRISFVRTTPRDPEDTGDVLSQSQGSDDWKFEFQHGTVATPDVMRTNQEEIDGISFQMKLDPNQAEVVMENPNYIDAVAEETVPDGNDFIRDNNPDSRNTVTITRPSSKDSEYLPNSGVNYIIRDWRLEWARPKRYTVNMTVRQE